MTTVRPLWGKFGARLQVDVITILIGMLCSTMVFPFVAVEPDSSASQSDHDHNDDFTIATYVSRVMHNDTIKSAEVVRLHVKISCAGVS